MQMPHTGLPPVTAIVVAAGASRRMGFDKLSYRLPGGQTVLEKSCAALAAHPAVTQLVLVAGANADGLPPHRGTVRQTLCGRARRGHARRQRAQRPGGGCGRAGGHPRRRPPLRQRGGHHGGAASGGCHRGGRPAVPVKDTIKVAGPGGVVQATPDRATLFAVQTPQCFSRALYLRALAAVQANRPILSPTIAACLSWPACR